MSYEDKIKQQAEPMAEATRGQLDEAGIAPAMDESGVRRPIPAVLDTGYFSEAAVAAMEREGFDPYIATGRQRHNTVATVATTEPAGTLVVPRGADEARSRIRFATVRIACATCGSRWAAFRIASKIVFNDSGRLEAAGAGSGWVFGAPASMRQWSGGLGIADRAERA